MCYHLPIFYVLWYSVTLWERHWRSAFTHWTIVLAYFKRRCSLQSVKYHTFVSVDRLKPQSQHWPIWNNQAQWRSIEGRSIAQSVVYVSPLFSNSLYSGSFLLDKPKWRGSHATVGLFTANCFLVLTTDANFGDSSLQKVLLNTVKHKANYFEQ